MANVALYNAGDHDRRILLAGLKRGSTGAFSGTQMIKKTKKIVCQGYFSGVAYCSFSVYLYALILIRLRACHAQKKILVFNYEIKYFHT